jgi:holo-[acyl-carrier protein] synthase
MILGVGLDLASCGPWRAALDDPSGAALEACFTPGELARVRNGPVHPAERLAARFAAKEAFIKALGGATMGRDPGAGLDLLDIEVDADSLGRPILVLHRDARARAEAAGVRRAHISLTHEDDKAAAVVMLEG